MSRPERSALSSSSHFPLMRYSEVVNPVALPPGRAKLATKPAATGSVSLREHDWHGAGSLQQRPDGRAARCEDDVRRECDQFSRVSPSGIGIPRAPAIVDLQVAAVSPAQLLQALHERRDSILRFRIVRGQPHQHPQFAAFARSAARAPPAAMQPPHRREA